MVLLRQRNALLLYNGPMSEWETGDLGSNDLLAIRLNDGKPTVTIAVTGDRKTELSITPPYELNDGKWHKLDFWFKSRVW